ncbi:hypothetical protein Tco_0843665 [Tanacetum coccineum]|uniref:Uncharacterized protein n=1 Tax=Tanacetum coccineum TaxID=301880 RepID=A0ABQ5B3X9_9ASTR
MLLDSLCLPQFSFTGKSQSRQHSKTVNPDSYYLYDKSSIIYWLQNRSRHARLALTARSRKIILASQPAKEALVDVGSSGISFFTVELQ